MTGRMRLAAGVSTVAIFALIARRIPMALLVSAFRDADYATFLALMAANTVFYFCWDTLVLTTVVRWFHADVSYGQILPVRAASYVVGFFNTNAGRGALAAYLWRRLGAPFLELGSTVIFLIVTEYTQLVLWAMLGILAFRSDLTSRTTCCREHDGANGMRRWRAFSSRRQLRSARPGQRSRGIGGMRATRSARSSTSSPRRSRRSRAGRRSTR